MNNETMPKILIIEDNQDDFEATSRSLKKNDIITPIAWCKSGKDALNYLNKTGAYEGKQHAIPDLILLDLNMPGVDGRKVLKEIKRNSKLCHIPIIILTTSCDNTDVDQCYELGASTYIQKPVSFEGLTDALGKMKDFWFDVAVLPSNNTNES